MDQILEEYWEKVSKEKEPNTNFLKVLKGEYQLKSRIVLSKNITYDDMVVFEKRAKQMRGSIKYSNDIFKFDLGTQFGIHSYQIIYFTKGE